MNKKTAGVILALLLIGSFFLPYLNLGGIKLSGFDIVFAKQGLVSKSGGYALFLLLLIPIGAIIALVATFFDSSQGFYNWLSLIGVLYLIVRIYILADSREIPLSDFMSFIAYGFWISLAASIALGINGGRKSY